MKINKAYTTITLEAAVGGYDTKDLHIVNSNGSELEEELEEISAEDYNEWAAASCGMTYNEYIGKPWLD